MSLRRLRCLVAVAAVGLVVAAGCSSGTSSGSAAPASGATRVVEADNGQITVPVEPERVVATGYAVPTLIEAGAPLVGISAWSRGVPMMTPEQVGTYNSLDRVAGEQAADTNYEAIARLEPDLIVLGVPVPVLGDIDVAQLQSLAPVVAIGPTLPDQWRELSRRQADAAGAAAGFDAAKAAYEAKAAALAEKYRDVVPRLKFGHVGGYGQVSEGTFHREFNGSWGTNIAQDVGVDYYGAVEGAGPRLPGGQRVPLARGLSASLGEADAISYTLNADGSVPPSVQRVLDSELWQNLPAVQAGRVFPFRYTEAATYGAATKTLDSIDQALTPLLQG